MYNDYSIWDALRDAMWGDSWSGYESVGRYITLALVTLVAGGIIYGVYSWWDSKQFIRSCYERGGHVHYSYRQVAGPVVIVGNIGIPTTSTSTTMTFAEGNEEDCKKCR
jgi:hypothetical protein